MNWRRGLVFVGIHLSICLGLVVCEDARYWSQLESSAVYPHTRYQFVAFDKDQFEIAEEPVTVNFDCRNLWYHMPLPQRIINIFELPAAVMTGWREPCPQRWTISEALNLNAGHHTRTKELLGASTLLFLIAMQWLVLGAIPSIRPRTWYLEPGVCITVCLVFSSIVGLFGSLLDGLHFRWVEGVMLVPGMLGFLAMAMGLLAWLWWFLLLLWKPVRPAWQSTLHGLRRLSN